MDAYTEAHIFVAAIRICENKNSATPTIEEICDILDCSAEHGHTICRKLKKKGIVATMETPFSFMVSITDHLAIELLPKEQEKEDSLAKEIEIFQANKRDMDKEVAAIQAEIDRKKQDMFAEMEAKLKNEFNKQ